MAKFTSKTETSETAIFASSGGEGVHGESKSPALAGVVGVQTNPTSIGAGIYGEHKGLGAGVVGMNTADGPGGYFRSDKKEAIFCESHSPSSAAIAGIQQNTNGTGAAIYGEHVGPNGSLGVAGFFKGNVIVTGDISFAPEVGDISEDFTVKDEALAEPGTVMSLNNAGELIPCIDPYEKRVVGVVAGAGSYRTGIIMDKQEKSDVRRQPIALVGKVFCKVDASYGPIEIGDLLTSSATHGHAMKASNPNRAFGSVLGKALAPLSDGLGLIPILISLQ